MSSDCDDLISIAEDFFQNMEYAWNNNKSSVDFLICFTKIEIIEIKLSKSFEYWDENWKNECVALL